MGRLAYEDWVPEEDRNRFTRIEQAIGELESNPSCREASSTLFWQVFFGLTELSAVIEFEREVHEMETIGYSFEDAASELKRERNRDNEYLLAYIRKDVRENKLEHPLPWIGLDLVIVDRIFDLLLGLNREPEMDVIRGGQDRLLSVAFTQLHLASILLRVASKLSWGGAEMADDLVSLGERAFGYIRENHELYGGIVLSERQALQLLQQAGFYCTPIPAEERDRVDYVESPPKSPLQEEREQSLSAVMSLFLNERFKANKKRGSNEEALSSFAMAVALWARSTSALAGELSLQAGVDCCEEIFLNKSTVSDWDGVANSCCLIVDHLSEIPDSDDLSIVQYVLDKQGWSWVALSYWQRASTRAENEMSPTQFKQLQDLERQSTHLSRLRNDFLGDLASVLEPESLRALIQGEIAWYESQPAGGRIEATANELRHVFESELRVLIFERAKETVSQILHNQELRRRLNIKSRDTSRLSLREMAILLTEAGNTHSLAALGIRDLVEGFPVSREDKDFLCVYLPQYLHALSDVRRSSEHPSRSDAVQLRNKTRDVRRKALGIGDKSYLERLLTIKEAVCRG